MVGRLIIAVLGAPLVALYSAFTVATMFPAVRETVPWAGFYGEPVWLFLVMPVALMLQNGAGIGIALIFFLLFVVLGYPACWLLRRSSALTWWSASFAGGFVGALLVALMLVWPRVHWPTGVAFPVQMIGFAFAVGFSCGAWFWLVAIRYHDRYREFFG